MKTKKQYAVIQCKRKNAIRQSPRMRNPSKNTAKKIMRRAWKAWHFIFAECRQWNREDERNYFLFNWVGARLYVMSKGKICNREPKGYKRYCSKYRVSLDWDDFKSFNESNPA